MRGQRYTGLVAPDMSISKYGGKEKEGTISGILDTSSP